MFVESFSFSLSMQTFEGFWKKDFSRSKFSTFNRWRCWLLFWIFRFLFEGFFSNEGWKSCARVEKFSNTVFTQHNDVTWERLRRTFHNKTQQDFHHTTKTFPCFSLRFCSRFFLVFLLLTFYHCFWKPFCDVSLRERCGYSCSTRK